MKQCSKTMKRYLILAMLFCCSIAFAQNIKRPDSYNYSRGVEAIQNNNAEEALEYLNKELEENPDNGYALAWIAVVRNYQEEYGRALTAADLAIKHIPRKDKEYKAFAYIVRAEVYVGLGENEKALADFTSAVKKRLLMMLMCMKSERICITIWKSMIWRIKIIRKSYPLTPAM